MPQGWKELRGFRFMSGDLPGGFVEAVLCLGLDAVKK